MNALDVTPEEIFLHPGEYHFGEGLTRIWTVLGSCVSLTFWHPQRLIGGMCHIMLPRRTGSAQGEPPVMDGRYADEALNLLFRSMAEQGSWPNEFVVKLFGGGNMFPQYPPVNGYVGDKNVETVLLLLQQYGLSCAVSHTGGAGHRKIMFDVWSGNVWVKQADSTSSCPPLRCERGDECVRSG